MGAPKIACWTTAPAGVYWGQERTVVVTFNPRTARKQGYTLRRKLDALKAKHGDTDEKYPELVERRKQSGG